MNLIFILLSFFLIITSSIQSDNDYTEYLDKYYNTNSYLPQAECACKNLKWYAPTGQNSRLLDSDEINWFGSIFTMKKAKYKTYYVPLCSGILVHYSFALTSSSCLKNLVLKSYSRGYLEKILFFAGGGNKNLIDIYPNSSHRKPIVQIHFHPLFNETLGTYDLALVKFQTPYDREQIGPIMSLACLNHKKYDSGYEKHYFYFPAYHTSELQKKNLLMVPSDKKSDFFVLNSSLPLLISQKLISICPGKDTNYIFYCTESPKGKKITSCPSDSGSGLFYYDKLESRLIVVGINNMITNRFDMDSYKILNDDNKLGYADCGTRNFNMFTPIYKEIPWIISIVKKICLQPEIMKKNTKFCKCDNEVYTKFEDKLFRYRNSKDKSIKGRVVNGTKVDAKDFKYAALIFFTIMKTKIVRFGIPPLIRERNFYSICSATVVNRNFVLTAHHCFKYDLYGQPIEFLPISEDEPEPPFKSIYYAAAGNKRDAMSIYGEEYRRRIKKIHPHPNYREFNSYYKLNNPKDNVFAAYDVCLVEIYGQFNFDSKSNIMPACLQDFNPRIEDDSLKYVFGVGYGVTEKVVSKQQRDLFEAQNKYHDNQQLLQIQMVYEKGDLSNYCPGDDRVICMYTLYGATCYGDSGGGNYRYDIKRNKFYTAGVLSYGQNFRNSTTDEITSCKDSAISVYSSVYHNLDFIKSIIGNDACWTDNDPYYYT